MISKKQYFKIGEMAELFGLNIRTLRYYDRIGLLKPDFTDPGSGYRYYSTAQFEPLNTIRYLRELGVSLDEIRGFLENREIGSMKAMMQEQLRIIEHRRKELDLIQRKLQTKIAQIERAQEGPLDTVEFREIGPRPAQVLRYGGAPDSDLEYPIRLLAKELGTQGVFLGMIGLSISEQKLAGDQFESYDYIFLLPDPAEQENITEETPAFAEGTYAVLRFRGTHTAAASHYRTLTRAIREQGYEICGNSLEITLIDYGLTRDTDNFVTEIQIPVRALKRGK